jgi:hypothetical protein
MGRFPTAPSILPIWNSRFTVDSSRPGCAKSGHSGSLGAFGSSGPLRCRSEHFGVRLKLLDAQKSRIVIHAGPRFQT